MSRRYDLPKKGIKLHFFHQVPSKPIWFLESLKTEIFLRKTFDIIWGSESILMKSAESKFLFIKK